MNLKHAALQLCTCMWIEIMTGAGITLYMLYMQQYTLAAVTAAVFAPLIAFHFAVEKLKPGNRGESRVVRIKSLSGRQWPQNTSSSTEIVRAQ